MNISEAIDVHTVLSFIEVHHGTFAPMPRPDSEAARIAAMRLADRTRKALRAGPTGADVQIAWRHKQRAAKRRTNRTKGTP